MRRSRRRLALGVVAAAALAMAASVGVGLASDAPTTCDPKSAGSANSGYETLLPACAAVHGDASLLSEKYAPSDYFPLYDPNFDPRAGDSPIPVVGGLIDRGKKVAGVVDTATDPAKLDAYLLQAAVNDMAAMIFLIVQMVAMLTSRLVEWTFTFDIAGSAGDSVDNVVGAMASKIYEPYLPAVLVLVGLWLAYHAILRRRATQGFQGIAWVLLALGIGAAYTAPSGASTIVSGVNAFTASVAGDLLAVTAGVDPKVKDIKDSTATNAELRAFSDRYWTNFVYIPWTVATFGEADPTTPAGSQLGVELLECRKSNEDCSRSGKFFNDLKGSKWETWYQSQNNGFARLAFALVALVTVCFAGILFVIIALVVTMAQLALLLLMLIAPLFFLVGVHPAGRRLLIKWLELVAAALFIRIVYAGLLGILMVLSGVITDAVAKTNWGLAAALQVALVVAVLAYRKPFMAVFSQVGSARAVMSHISSPRMAERASGAMARAQGWLGRPVPDAAKAPVQGTAPSGATGVLSTARTATAAADAASASSAGAAGAGSGAAVAGAATGGAAVVAFGALKAGQKVIGGAARATRKMQEQAGAFIVDDGDQQHPGPYRAPRPPTNDSGEPLSAADIKKRAAERAAYSRARQQQRTEARRSGTPPDP